MKKSTTTGMLAAVGPRSNLSRSSTTSHYDYFSLGRRPKRMTPLRESVVQAISMDVLLKSRRNSLAQSSTSDVSEPALSVDDILKSCSEYDVNTGPFYRCRTGSDIGRKSPYHPLSFVEITEGSVSENNIAGDLPKQHSQTAHKPTFSYRPTFRADAIQNGRKIDELESAEKSKKKPGSLADTCSGRNTSSPPCAEGTVGSETNGFQVADDTERNATLAGPDAGLETSQKRQGSPNCTTTTVRTSGAEPTVLSVSFRERKDNGVGARSLGGEEQGETYNVKNSDPRGNPISPISPNDVFLPEDETRINQPCMSQVSSLSQGSKSPPTEGKLNQTRLDSKPTVSRHSVTTVTVATIHSSSSLDTSRIPSSSSPDVSSSAPSSTTTTTSTAAPSVSTPPTTTTTNSSSSAQSKRHVFSYGSSGSDPKSPLSPDSAKSPGLLTTLSIDTSGDYSQSGRSSPAPKSPNQVAKLEAVEGIKWLKAAGFPQYAQMFEDGQFPVDLSTVERDHDFLDKDSLQSLFRRLETLNKFAGMKIDAHPRKKATSEEDDDDDLCALSERWEYQKTARRWSRKDLKSPGPLEEGDQPGGPLARSGSHDSLLADQDSGSQTGDSPLLDHKMPHSGGVEVEGRDKMTNLSHGGDGQQGFPISPRLRRVASERMKTAKNLWRKMEGGLKTKKSRRSQRNQAMDISGPVLTDSKNMQAKLQRLHCVDISPTNENAPGVAMLPDGRPAGVARIASLEAPPLSPGSPDSSSSLPSPGSSHGASSKSSSSSSPMADVKSQSFHGDVSSLSSASTSSPTTQSMRNQHAPQTARDQPTSPVSPPHTDSRLNEYYTAQSQLQQTLQGVGRRHNLPKNSSDTNLMEIFLLPQDHQPGRFPRMLQNGYIETEQSGVAVNSRTGSVRFGKDTCTATPDHLRLAADPGALSPRLSGNRVSVYDNFAPVEGSRSVIPGVIELGPPRAPRDSAQPHGHPSKLRSVSFESSERHLTSETCGTFPRSFRDRSISFESSSSGMKEEHSSSASPPETDATESESGDKLSHSIPPSTTSPSSAQRGVPHSASADSYFRDTAAVGAAESGDRTSSTTSIATTDSNTSSSTLQPSFDEFDLILKQLYDNINDLTQRVGSDQKESQPTSSTLSSTTTVSSVSSHQHATSSSAKHTARNNVPKELHLHTTTSTASTTITSVYNPSATQSSPQDEKAPRDVSFDLDIPVSPTSDLVVSPNSPLSPSVGTDESMLDGDRENENSSSGGEGSSHTAESISDQEVALTDLSHDDSLDQIPDVTRERRDSGVGHSLTRAPSEGRRKKIRWHSFQRCHRPDVSSRAMQINSLTIGQLLRLQKLSLLKLTGIMEKCLPVNKSGWNWMMPRFMKRQKAPDFSDKNVFGVPLSVMAQRTGQPLPQCVLYAMRYLRRTSQNAVGIFRKSGVKSKIQQLRDHLEAHPDTTDFEGVNAYNVADMLKTYFRDLPECLLTSKLSETFRSIYTHVPDNQRLEAIQAAILLLPDENREVLQSILLFLSDIATHEKEHQMNASNLAVCFTPTVFMLGTRQLSAHSPKRNRKNSPGIPDPREIMEQKAAQECLTMMITESKRLFTVPSGQFRQLQVHSLAHMEPAPLQDLCGDDPTSEVKTWGQERIQMVLKVAHDKNRGWMGTTSIGDVEVSHRKPIDDCPLREWKFGIDIEAPPIEVLTRLMHERHAWDEDLLSWSVVERLDPDHSDIFQYVLNSMAPHPSRHFCVLRYWRCDLQRGACAMITMSVEHTDVSEVQGVRAVDHGSYYLMEPCGSGRARITYVTRVDTRGRTPEWYSKIFGHITANFLERLRDSFKQEASGPETKV